MTSSEKFSLRWNDFQANISSAFSNLRDNTNLTDVTLVSEDGQHMEAHNILLSASSPFFMNLLKTSKHPSPLVYLKGFKAKDLHSILDFMYHGVAEIYQENLDAFLAVAEQLQLKGLTGEQGEDKENTQEVEKNIYINTEDVKKTKTSKPSSQNEIEPYYNKEYDSEEMNRVVATNKQTVAQVSFSGGSAEDLKATLWSMISQNGTLLTCTVCGKSKDKTQDMYARKHMESHVESLHTEGVVYDCNKCDKTFRSKNALHKHTQQVHNRR